MYPISAAARALYEAEQPQVLRITGTDKNGLAISITDADIMTNTFSIDRYCCNGSKLEIGTAIAAEMTMKLNNTDGRFDNVVFEGTELYVEIGIADWSLENPTVYWMPCGYFIPDEQPRRMDIITINAMDRMQLFDRLITEPSTVKWTDNNNNTITDENGVDLEFNSFVAFPNEVGNIILQACKYCGVTTGMAILGRPNSRYVIPEMPSIQTPVTYRNLIQWCAGIMGDNAYIDWNGQLRVGKYNSTSYSVYSSTLAKRYQSDYYENDLAITGVQYTNVQNVAIVSGSSEYALDLKGNMLVAPYIADILPVLSDIYVGYSYRPFSASVINAPYLWPMDRVSYTDKDGNVYASVLTNVNFGINCKMGIKSVGETEQTNKNVVPTSLTSEQAQLINEAINGVNDLDKSLNQEDIFNRLTNNGEAQGIYMQDGKLYINLTYARAGTLILGGLNNQNGMLQMLDADGNLIGTWDNTGASISGTLTNKTTDENNNVYAVEIVNGGINIYINNTFVGSITGNEINQSIKIGGNSHVEIGVFSGSSITTSYLQCNYGEFGIFADRFRINAIDGIYVGASGKGYTGTIADSGGNTFYVMDGIIMEP